MINGALITLVQKYPGLLELSDLKNLKTNQLTAEHLYRIAKAFGVTVPFTDELVHAFIAMLKGKDVNEVADLIKDPASLRDIVAFLTGGFKEVRAIRVPDDDVNFYIGAHNG